MDQTTYLTARRGDLLRLAEWLTDISQKPQQQCLITWSGESSDALWQHLVSTMDAGEMVFTIALQKGQLVGALGAEYDEELGRSWLLGPHCSAEDWDTTAEHLYTRLLSLLPAGIRQWDAYLNEENQRGRRFYSARGFEERPSRSYVFQLSPSNRISLSLPDCSSLGNEHEESFSHLFDAIFPNTYYSPQRIIAMHGHSHHVFIKSQGEELLGFAVTSVDEGHTSGEIQFLGVRADVRRQGLGRQLLMSGVNWLFDTAGITSIWLNVNEDQVHARQLYESAGFQLRYSGVSLCKLSQT